MFHKLAVFALLLGFSGPEQSWGHVACMPGFWCQRSELVIDHDTNIQKCPVNFWCRRSPAVIRNSRSMLSHPKCSSGHWCRKKILIELLSDRKCPIDFVCNTKRN